MKSNPVIKGKNFPARFPFVSIAVTYLLLDKFKAPEWIWGASGFFWLLIIVCYFIAKFNEVPKDIFEK